MSAQAYPPRVIAWAIADLAADRARAAHRYLAAHSALTRAGVPLEETINVLEAPERNTHALGALRAWVSQGARGVLIMHGLPGTGKSHAGASWVLERHCEQRSARYLAAASWGQMDRDAQRRELDACAGAAALVIDDIGAGLTQGAYLRDAFEGMVLARVGARRPTLILSNANAVESRAWIGARVWSRLGIGGGIIEVTGIDLRGDDPSSGYTAPRIETDETGRTARHRDALRIVDLLGIEVHDDGLRVGAALERRAKREGFPACKQARELLGLDVAAVQARADELIAAERRALAETGDALGVQLTAQMLTWEAVFGEIAAAVFKRKVEQREAHRRETDAIVFSAMLRSRREAPAAKLPSTRGRNLDADRELGKRCGFAVRMAGSTWTLTHAAAPEPGKRPDAPRLIADRLPSEAAAWALAASHCGAVPLPEEVAC